MRPRMGAVPGSQSHYHHQSEVQAGLRCSSILVCQVTSTQRSHGRASAPDCVESALTPNIEELINSSLSARGDHTGTRAGQPPRRPAGAGQCALVGRSARAERCSCSTQSPGCRAARCRPPARGRHGWLTDRPPWATGEPKLRAGATRRSPTSRDALARRSRTPSESTCRVTAGDGHRQ